MYCTRGWLPVVKNAFGQHLFSAVKFSTVAAAKLCVFATLSFFYFAGAWPASLGLQLKEAVG